MPTMEQYSAFLRAAAQDSGKKADNSKNQKKSPMDRANAIAGAYNNPSCPTCQSSLNPSDPSFVGPRDQINDENSKTMVGPPSPLGDAGSAAPPCPDCGSSVAGPSLAGT